MVGPFGIEVGVSSRRTLILIAAIVVGALAAYGIYNYVGGIEDRANANARRVPVVRVAQDIPRGLTGEEALAGGYLENSEIPEEFLPGNSIRPADTDVIRAKVSGANLVTGQVLVEGMFVDPIASQITAARRIASGNVAITVEVDQVRGVAGLIVPGDLVNIMVRPSNSLCEAQATDENGNPLPQNGQAGNTLVFCFPARYLYQQVKVLFVDRSPVPLPGEDTAAAVDENGNPVEPQNRGLITFEVPPGAAQLLASLGDSENIYLTLLPTDYVPSPLGPFDPTLAVLPGEDGNLLTPYGPSGPEPDNTP